MPSRNVTVPSVTGPPANDTVAVNVTDWPNPDGFTFAATAVAELARFTVWVSPAELASSVPAPLNWAVMECGPVASDDVGKAACPEPFRLTVPRVDRKSVV